MVAGLQGRCTPGPTASTTPEPSSPSTIGIGMPVCEPSAAWRQLWHTPLATILTRTSPNRGFVELELHHLHRFAWLDQYRCRDQHEGPPRSCVCWRLRSARGRSRLAPPSRICELYNNWETGRMRRQVRTPEHGPGGATSPSTVARCSAKASRGMPARTPCYGSTSTGDLAPARCGRTAHTSQPLATTTSVVVPHPTWRIRRRRRPRQRGRSTSAARSASLVATLPEAGDGRANDGRCDPHGRLWVGTVDRRARTALRCSAWTSRGRWTKILSGRALSNGIDWSPDGRRCYHADSLLKRIDVLMLDDDGFPTGAESSPGSRRCPTG